MDIGTYDRLPLNALKKFSVRNFFCRHSPLRSFSQQILHIWSVFSSPNTFIILCKSCKELQFSWIIIGVFVIQRKWTKLWSICLNFFLLRILSSVSKGIFSPTQIGQSLPKIIHVFNSSQSYFRVTKRSSVWLSLTAGIQVVAGKFILPCLISLHLEWTFNFFC